MSNDVLLQEADGAGCSEDWDLIHGLAAALRAAEARVRELERERDTFEAKYNVARQQWSEALAAQPAPAAGEGHRHDWGVDGKCGCGEAID